MRKNSMYKFTCNVVFRDLKFMYFDKSRPETVRKKQKHQYNRGFFVGKCLLLDELGSHRKTSNNFSQQLLVQIQHFVLVFYELV